MCGIVAYIGKKNAKDLLIDGLRSLEYRGYDSSGIAVLHNSKIELVKSAGKIARLEEKILSLKAPALVTNSVSSNFNSHVAEKINLALETSTCGIGHTRWATHGIANDTNAHPHQDTEANIALVHNGIIKNYLSLKQELEAEGIQFRTETDTEVITHLFAKQFVIKHFKSINDFKQQFSNQYNRSWSPETKAVGKTILGDDEFVQEIIEKYVDLDNENIIGRKEMKQHSQRNTTKRIHKYIKGLDINQNLKQHYLIYLLLENTNISRKGLGTQFNLSANALGKRASRVRQSIQKDSSLKQLLDFTNVLS